MLRSDNISISACYNHFQTNLLMFTVYAFNVSVETTIQRAFTGNESFYTFNRLDDAVFTCSRFSQFLKDQHYQISWLSCTWSIYPSALDRQIS